jgi:hypothetical protein
MNIQENLEQIFKYSNEGEHEKIIEFTNNLSEEEKVFPVMCQLACA